MMHLIKKGNKYLVMASDIETIQKYCGIDAKILFSWNEEDKEALKSFFSRMRLEPDMIDLCAVSGISKEETKEIIDNYYEQDQIILSTLNDIEVIDSKERNELEDISESSKKKQLDLVVDSYLRNPFKK